MVFSKSGPNAVTIIEVSSLHCRVEWPIHLDPFDQSTFVGEYSAATTRTPQARYMTGSDPDSTEGARVILFDDNPDIDGRAL